MTRQTRYKKRPKQEVNHKLIEAVGEIIREEGYKGLGVNKIAKRAEVDKKYIYMNFGSVEHLIETYILEKDYWLTFAKKLNQKIGDQTNYSVKELACKILEEQFDYFYQHEEMQKIILWEISEKNDLMQGIHNAREALGVEILKLFEGYFAGSNINIRAIEALLVSGIYYLVLHAKTNGSTVSSVDINTEKGRKEIHAALRQIMEWAFEAAKQERKK